MYTNIGPFHTFKSPTKKVDTTLINVIYLLFKKNLSENTKKFRQNVFDELMAEFGSSYYY